MVFIQHVLWSIGVLITIIDTHVFIAEACWRPRQQPPSVSLIRLAPNNNNKEGDGYQNQSIQYHHPTLLQASSSLFGIGDYDTATIINQRRRKYLSSLLEATSSIRGGDANISDDSDNEQETEVGNINSKTKNNKNNKSKNDDDDERYSRQMYALGARAHKLVRSTTAILDGPLGGGKCKQQRRREDVRIEGADGFDGLDTTNDSKSHHRQHVVRRGNEKSNTPSGLLYEIAKNLALSGVGRIILVQDDDDDDDDDSSTRSNSSFINDSSGYFDGSLDDLGAAYHRAALAEIGGDGDYQGIKNLDDRDSSEMEEDEEEQGNSDDFEEERMYNSFLDNGSILLSEYIQRLNPGVQVDIVTRSRLIELLKNADSSASSDTEQVVSDDKESSDDDDEEEQETVSLGTNPVVVCVDRSISSQLAMNDVCRNSSHGGSSGVPFISVETAGVQAKLFCDFGPNFVVVDEDGETSRSTLLERVEKKIEEKDDERNGDEEVQYYIIKCLEGERHDVSKDDIIEFQGEHDSDDHIMNAKVTSFPMCQVISVKSPTCFHVKEWKEGETMPATARSEASHSVITDSSSSMESLLQGKARSFSRVKLPKKIPFSSLRHILQPVDGDDRSSTTSNDCCNDDTLFAPSDLDKSFDPLRRRAVMTCMSALDEFVKKYGHLPSRFSEGESYHHHHNNHRGEKKNDKSKQNKQHRTDIERFQSMVRKITKNVDDSLTNNEQWQSLITQFARTCRAKFTPVQAFAGALGAQEALKAATGLYNPVKQFLLYDCDEVLQGCSEEQTTEAAEICDVKFTTGQSYILGEELSNKLARSRIFIIGAGAIGCELLKNLAAMGAGTGASNTKQGCLILTDMDTIEKSNLSRQLLFRDHDVGEFKSVAARAAMMRFSPDCRVEVHTSRVSEEEDGPFDDDFWSSGCNVVLNALDNMEARLFVDSQCVTYGLGLIDAGTLGSKGNVQVVLPHESESYGSSADPPEPDIPVCTLKNFPYEISHTIQWARDLFDGYFHRRPRQANDHVEEMALTEELTAFGQSLIDKLGDDAAVDMAKELGEDLGPFPFVVGNADSSDPEYVMAVKKVSLEWAIQQAHKLFFVAMEELIQKHPIDSLDDDGAPFWSGTRKIPRPLRFIPLDSEEDEVSAQQVIINERIAQFVSATARLRMESFLSAQEEDDDALSPITLEEALFALQEQAKLLSETKKKKSKEILHNLSGGGSDNRDTLSLILDRLNGAKTGASFLPTLSLADFEKDDESNGHVSFVTAASNLRAMAYGIPPADAMETRRVSGRIVPAMITTTGLVSALSCLELVKVMKGLPLTMHRNAFVNLALPFFAFTSPMPAEEVMGVNGKTHTIWDRISIKGSSNAPTETMTLKCFLEKVQKKAGCEEGIEISSLSYGPYLIYANFLHSHDEELLDTPLLKTVRDAVISEEDNDTAFDDEETTAERIERPTDVDLTASQKKILSKLDQKRFIDFSVTVEDVETGEEFELPPVRLVKDKQVQPQRLEDDIEQ